MRPQRRAMQVLLGCIILAFTSCLLLQWRHMNTQQTACVDELASNKQVALATTPQAKQLARIHPELTCNAATHQDYELVLAFASGAIISALTVLLGPRLIDVLIRCLSRSKFVICEFAAAPQQLAETRTALTTEQATSEGLRAQLAETRTALASAQNLSADLQARLAEMTTALIAEHNVSKGLWTQLSDTTAALGRQQAAAERLQEQLAAAVLFGDRFSRIRMQQAVSIVSGDGYLHTVSAALDTGSIRVTGRNLLELVSPCSMITRSWHGSRSPTASLTAT